MASSNTLQRIFKTIDLVLEKNDGATFSYLQSELAIAKSSMHSILKELVAQDILYFNQKTKTYMVGGAFVQLSARCMAQVNFVREISTVASDLCALTKCTVSASILRERQIVYIVEQLDRSGSRMINVGLSFPAHTTAMGKLLLSALSDTALSRMYDGVHFEVFTENTIKNFDELLSTLRQIRQLGYATDKAEFAPTVGCLAVPIIFDGKSIAAMSITTNIAKLTDSFIQAHLPLLREASAEVTRKMGGVPVVPNS